MSTYEINDTIAAIATPAGEGGISIIRLSGPQALKIADQIFQAKAGQPPSRSLTHTVRYGAIVSHDQKQAQIIDEVLLLVMRAPRTYTREDVVEIHCHGGSTAVRAILNLVLQKGARLAHPGEFTKRAFLNGRIDLTQAEAVLHIVQAKTDLALDASMRQLKGELACELEAIREVLADAYVELEAMINFPEDDLDASSITQLQEKNVSALSRVSALCDSGQEGRMVQEGARVVLCGKPNVGKSSLLNVLLKEPRAIVSSTPGTTRDTIEEFVQMNGIPIYLIDTAGILQPRDDIEAEAIRRSRYSIEGADLVLFVLDASRSLDQEDESLARDLRTKNVLLVCNKSDCPVRLDPQNLHSQLPHSQTVYVSALYQNQIPELKDKMVAQLLGKHAPGAHRLMIHNARQLKALMQCRDALVGANQNFQERISLEFIAEEIKRAIAHLDEVTGRDISTDLLDKIFSSFCIGK